MIRSRTRNSKIIKGIQTCLGMLLAFGSLSLSIPSAQGALSIIVGTHNLAPETAVNTVQIFVVDDGGAPVPPLTDAIQFNVELHDGSTTSAPLITGVDVITGTLLSASGSQGGGQDGANNRFEVTASVGTAVSFPAGSSLAGTITISTVGISSGTYKLDLTTPAGPTAYVEDGTANPIAMTISDGFVTVPEPSFGMLFGLAGSAWLFRRSRQATK